MEKTSKAEARLVKQGTILVMASATVGRAIVATKAHENTIVSHHFMRVIPSRDELSGWIYAFLRSPQALSMMKGSQYASIIRHIEPHHLHALPIPTVSDDDARYFRSRVATIVECRNKAASLRREAEAVFGDAIAPAMPQQAETGFSVKVSRVASGRRRLEAAYHTPVVRGIIQSFDRWDPLRDLVERAWWGKRFKRNYGDGGIPYRSADDVFTTNPYSNRRILVAPDDEHEDYFVREGWLILACSGQVYGLNGSATIATRWHENTFFSHDLIRIQPKATIRPGYLLTAMTHPILGRPLLMREAYGMSIPHLDPADVAAFPVARLDPMAETEIADLAERAVSEQTLAEVLERELSEAAGRRVTEFMMQ